jgi:peptide/nickel transport system substrate-binding protein
MDTKRIRQGRTARGALSRRRFLRYGMAATAAALQPVTPLTPGSRAFAASSTPRRGGTLKIAWASSPLSIDPARAISGDEYMITAAIYDNLTRVDEKFTVQPQLATRWESNITGDVWTFSLRRGVKFHHGRELTARDVVFTFERILDPKTASPGRTTMGPIDKVEAVDDYTVRFRLSIPYADLPVSLGTTFGRIVPADRAALIATGPSGTGPFRLAEYRPGAYTRLVRFQNYWDQGRPYLDELWQVNIPEMAGQIAALTGGSVHALFEVPAPFIPSLQQASGVSVVEVRSPGFQPLTMKSTEKPFDDARVRQAMKYLVDREALTKAIWQGHASVGEDHSVPSFSPFYAATTPPHTYDVAKAKALLAEAGYPTGISVELWTSNERVGLQELAVAFQQMAAPAGVKVEVKTVPWSVHVATVYKKKPLYCNNWFGRASIDEALYPFFRTGGGFNDAYTNKDLDTLLDTGRATIDPQKRKGFYGRAEQLIHEDGPWVVAYFTTYVSAMRSNVKGLNVHPLRWWNFREAYFES